MEHSWVQSSPLHPLVQVPSGTLPLKEGPLTIPGHGSDRLVSYLHASSHPPLRQTGPGTDLGLTVQCPECYPGQTYLHTQGSSKGFSATHPTSPPSQAGPMELSLLFTSQQGWAGPYLAQGVLKQQSS